VPQPRNVSITGLRFLSSSLRMICFNPSGITSSFGIPSLLKVPEELKYSPRGLKNQLLMTPKQYFLIENE